MWFVVVGERQGQTFKGGSLGSPIHFTDGMIEVPDDAKDYHNLLRNFYSAYPQHEVKMGEDGKLIHIESDTDGALKPNFKLPVAVKELPAEGAVVIDGDGSQPPVFDKPKDKPKGGK